jgi:glycosyltransferase involved in cell wall biosynthesis
MANILLLTQVLPYPPDSGPKVKTHNVIKYLARQHRVTLASFVRGDQQADATALKQHCAAVHTVPIDRPAWRDGLALGQSLLTGQPWMMLRDDRAAMRQLVRQLSMQTRFDIAHADQLNMAQYALRVPGARLLLDLHNALWLLYKRLAETMPRGPRRMLLERDWRLLKRYEGALCRRAHAVLAVSDEDRIALAEAIGPEHPAAQTIHVVPISIDGDAVPAIVRAPDAQRLMHVGTMYWPPNIDGMHWFIDAILPLIHAELPQTGFDIIGARPPKSLHDAAERDPRVNVTGYVEDVYPLLTQCAVFVVPLRAGGGMRVKILNALAQGLPIVTTSLGCEGIVLRHGEHALIADTPADFAAAVLALLQDRTRAAALGQAARRLFEARYDYRVALQPLDAVL